MTGFAITHVAAAGTDASSNPPALLALLSSGFVTNAGHLYVQNQSANQVQLVLNPGATQTVILIDPGAGANAQGADWQAAQNAPFFVGPFKVYGTDGAQVAVIYN